MKNPICIGWLVGDIIKHAPAPKRKKPDNIPPNNGDDELSEDDQQICALIFDVFYFRYLSVNHNAYKRKRCNLNENTSVNVN